MDNKGFCELLKEAKKMSGKSNIDIIVETRKSETTMGNMLRGDIDYALVRYLPYIDCFGFRLCITKGKEKTIISSEEDVKAWINAHFPKEDNSSYQLCEKLGTSNQTAWRILNGKTVRLSLFLKLIDLSRSKLTLEAKNI